MYLINVKMRKGYFVVKVLLFECRFSKYYLYDLEINSYQYVIDV